MNSVVLLILVLSLIATKVLSQECGCNQIPSIEIVNDPQIANDIKEVRDFFLSKQPSSKFNRLSATILIRQNKTNVWRRGSVDATLLAYPASSVKLMYMYSAIEWCKSLGQPIDCLDQYVRPMIIVSSNLDTGYIVDAITNTTNIDDMTSTNDTRWAHWYYQRLSTERLLQKLNLYENQILRSKTYPTNSGELPVGSELLIRTNPYPGNLLQSCCTASFMLYLMQTRPADELEYMKSKLYRIITAGETTFGNGLPAGTVLYAKPGCAYDTLEEIAYIVLPNGNEVILSAYSNAFQRPASDFFMLGRFAELVLQKFSLMSPSSAMIFTADDPDIYTCVDRPIIHNSSLPKDTISKSVITFEKSCIIHPRLSERGVYSVSIWTPSYYGGSTSSSLLNVAVTDVYNFTDGSTINQKVSLSQWISVGDFLLNPGQQTVSLTAINQESVFDAVRFSLRPPLSIQH